MIRLSFIIPAFNAAKTIGATLESIVALGLDSSEFEVLVVDDCSTDDTVGVVEGFKGSIPGLILLKQAENHMQGAARNRALSVARGTFVTFVDADDRVLPGMVKALEMIESEGADLCFSPMERILKGEDKAVWRLDTDRPFCLSGREVCETIFDPSCTLFLAACGYIIRHSLIQEQKRPFVEDHKAEDTDFTLFYMSKAEKVCYNPVATYSYIDNSCSTIHIRSIAVVKDFMLLAERLLDLAEHELEELPSFKSKVKDDVAGMCLDRLALWSLGKLKTSAVSSLYQDFSPQRRYRLAELKTKAFQRFVLKHRWLASSFLAIYHPLIMHKWFLTKHEV